jgi:hypothetical protein
MKSVFKRIHRGISERSDISWLHKPGSISAFRSRSKGPMLIPYPSNRLLPLVVADSASSFYDTKFNNKSFSIAFVAFGCFYLPRVKAVLNERPIFQKLKFFLRVFVLHIFSCSHHSDGERFVLMANAHTGKFFLKTRIV